MDADASTKRRARTSPHRERRWSMNSQRLEEIVAELMRPIGDLRRSFATDLSALLEEYLTEAGLHALEAVDRGGGGGELATPVNFAELALLLQQSASIYGRKVDFLYQHVLSVSDSLHTTLELSNSQIEDETETGGEAGAELEAATPSRRRRRHEMVALTEGDSFAPIQLEIAKNAKRDTAEVRPPPTLPRMYIELEPRQLTDADIPLTDYNGEPIGLLSDFHVSWRLQDGLLVDELEGNLTASSSRLRPIPLTELQAAIEASAPPPPPPLSPPTPPPPPAASTPLPPDDDMPPPPPPPPPPLPKRDRKRKSDVEIDCGGKIRLIVTKELSRYLRRGREFDLSPAWAAPVVAVRVHRILTLRKHLWARFHLKRPPNGNGFRGFDYSSKDINGFLGWSSSESAEALALAERVRSRLLHDDSDDDGFFEQSDASSRDSDRLSAESLNKHNDLESQQRLDPDALSAAEWAAWQAAVVARAHANEARGAPDVRTLASQLLAAIPADTTRHVDHVLADTAKQDTDVSRLFLATLFLANAGNVEVIQGSPLTVNSFSLRVTSRDERRYSAAAARDQPLLS